MFEIMNMNNKKNKLNVINLDINNLDILEKSMKELLENSDDVKSFFLFVVDKNNESKMRRFGNPLEILMFLKHYLDNILEVEFKQNDYKIET